MKKNCGGKIFVLKTFLEIFFLMKTILWWRKKTYNKKNILWKMIFKNNSNSKIIENLQNSKRRIVKNKSKNQNVSKLKTSVCAD